MLALIKELIAAQLVVEESAEQFAFRHALTRQAIYAQLLVRERKALHRTIAETFERLYAGRSRRTWRIWPTISLRQESGSKRSRMANMPGEQAQALYAPRAATQHFTRALDAASQLSLTPPASLYRARGLAYETLGEFERARDDHEQAFRLPTKLTIATGNGRSCLTWACCGQDVITTRTGRTSSRHLPWRAPWPIRKLLAHSLNRLGNWYLNVEQPQEALRYHQEALATFQALSDRRGKASTLDLLGMASLLSGDLMQSAVYNQQAIVLFRELDDRERLPTVW